MEETRVTWTKSPVSGAHANPPKIRHASLRRHLGKNPITVEIEVSPKRGSEDRHSFNLYFVIVQNMHIRAFGDFFNLRNEFRDLLPIKLVIPQNINDRAVCNSFEYPFNPIPSGVNVARSTTTSERTSFIVNGANSKWRSLKM